MNRSPGPGSKAVRFRVLAMLVPLAFIMYLNRDCISITAPAMMRDLKLSPLDEFRFHRIHRHMRHL